MLVDSYLRAPIETLTPMQGESLSGWYYRLEHAPFADTELPRFEIKAAGQKQPEVSNFRTTADEIISVTGIRREGLRALLYDELRAWQTYSPWVFQSSLGSEEKLLLPSHLIRACDTCLVEDQMLGKTPTIRPDHCTPFAIYCRRHGVALFPIGHLRKRFFQVSDHYHNYGEEQIRSKTLGMGYPTATNLPAARNVSDVFAFDADIDIGKVFGWTGSASAFREAIFAVFYILSKRRLQYTSNIGNRLLGDNSIKWAFPTLDIFDAQHFGDLDVHRKSICLNIVGQFLASGTCSIPIDLLKTLDKHYVRFINREKQVPHRMRVNFIVLLASLTSSVATDIDQEEISALFPSFGKRWLDATSYLDSLKG